MEKKVAVLLITMLTVGLVVGYAIGGLVDQTTEAVPETPPETTVSPETTKQLQTLQSQVDDKEKQVNELLRQVSALQKQVESLQQQVADKDEKISELESQITTPTTPVNGPAPTEKPEVKGMELKVLNSTISPNGVVKGEVQSVGSEKIKTAVITVKFYDAEGKSVDTRKAYINDIDPGETREFRTLLGINATRYEIYEIEYRS
ncbi:MAG: FxLYD domain-containing protein [Methanocellales archaeon]|nr:FxLYD domain-containing protein [Methanocellales archaeon]MDD5234966.1 FxLYD domain-containing protein [Methanocellales archaeon]